MLRADQIATALHGETVGVQPDPRHLNIEGLIMNQIDRIGYLRSIGEEWDEPMFHLRDLIVGLEDSEFWDGIPAQVRGKLTDAQKEEYAQRGWDGLKIQIHTDPKTGSEILCPTPAELSLMFRLVMGLMARRGMSWRRQSIDVIPMEVTQ
jgi:hypothetical protein